MRLSKYHGLGNDYLVWEGACRLTPPIVRALCDRHRGPGGDGVLEPVDTERADLGVVIHNPDGSEAEKSGNGIRILARWWTDVGRAPDRSFTVWTGHDRVRCVVGPAEVSVEMGRVCFTPERVPVKAKAPVIEGAVDVEGTGLHITALSIGNPHCVVFVAPGADLDTLPWRRWGAALENHPLFPRRTNVQFVRALTPWRWQARIWERGAGETQASGSSSCAVVGAAVRTGRAVAGRHEVVMPGGTLQVDLSRGGDATLTGPVVRVGEFLLDPAWFEDVRQG